MARVRATGSVAPARYGGHRRPLLGPHEGVLRALVAKKPDITLAELQAELHRQRSVTVCLATIHAYLRRLGLRHKKRA
jgi:putative transposase